MARRHWPADRAAAAMVGPASRDFLDAVAYLRTGPGGEVAPARPADIRQRHRGGPHTKV